MKIESSKRFHKAYARLSPTQRKAVDKALLAYGENRHHPALQDHALTIRFTELRPFVALEPVSGPLDWYG
jgi:mRNA-degrading endonuclease YafQ of YafQ-DinJ toxin-antitoxin module